MNNFKPYPKYKDSGVEWLGEIPEAWNVTPGFTVVSERNAKNTGMARSQVLSLSYGNVIIKPEEKLTGLVPESFETYQFVDPGNIIIRPTDMQNDHTSLRTGLANDLGIITSAYLNLEVSEGHSERFTHYYLHSIDTNKVIYGLGSGLRQNLDYRDFKRFPFLDIPKSEQIAIANFLDEKVGQIDAAIAQKERLIELLNERKQIIIQNAVTKGLNPKAPMRDSGIEWIGEIPEHWEVSKSQWLFGHRKEKCELNDDILTASQKYGVIPQNLFMEKEGRRVMVVELNPSILKKARKGDFVISMRSFQGGLEYCAYNGAISSAYVALLAHQEINDDYFKFLFKSNRYIEALGNTSNLVRDGQALRYDNFRMVELPVAPLDEQFKIAKLLNNVVKKNATLIKQAELSIEKLKEYKATLINSAVTGKIDVSTYGGGER